MKTTEGERAFPASLCEREWPKALAVTGALGSGKTEWVLNMALGFRECGEEVTVADVDIINPYFCVRQVADSLRKEGFRILTPPESTRWSDMPVMAPEVAWAVKSPGGRLLVDVGGDAAGGRALKQISAQMKETGYLLVLVVNPFRPSTMDTEGVLELVKGIERISELKVGALVANPHLMDQTTAEDLLWGYRRVSDSGKALGLEVLYGTVSPRLVSQTGVLQKDSPLELWPMVRRMMLPWEEGYMWTRVDDRS